MAINTHGLRTELQQQLSQAEFAKRERQIYQYCNVLTTDLGRKQHTKFNRDGVHTRGSAVYINTPHATDANGGLGKRKNRVFRRRQSEAAKQTDINPVVNLSDVSLSQGEIQLLSKGLNFCPKPRNYNAATLKDNVHAFTRRMRLREFFSDRNPTADSQANEHESEVKTISPFRKKSDWTPPRNRSAQLESYIEAVEQDISSHEPILGRVDNLSQTERYGLHALESKHHITIKPADKGSAVVVMNTADYIAEANKQLRDEHFYRKVDTDPTSDYKQMVTDTLDELLEQRHIDSDEHHFMVPCETREGRFYLLPKIHKPGNPKIPPCRPVISTINHPTENISAFLDYHMRPHVINQPSFVKDTTDYINKTPKVNLPDSTLLLTMDVTSLYTNIPHSEGIEACRNAWDTRASPTVPTRSLVELLKLVLKLNNFGFNGEHYIQVSGTAIGTKMAPSYANIFMAQLEERLLNEAPYKPLSWLRFIDDIESKWCDTEDHLVQFIDHANSHHPTIKFTTQYSQDSNTFLDTTSTLHQGQITFDLYSKPTDTHQYLLPTSCHPQHCVKGIPYSQALRVRRICSSEELFTKRTSEMKHHFLRRGYAPAIVESAVNKAGLHDRSDLLKYKEPKTTSRIPFVTTFHPALPPIGQILHKHWNIIQSNRRLANIFPEPPLLAFKRPKNLKDMLVHSVVQTDVDVCHPGVTKCGGKHCQTCLRVPSVSTFSSTVTGQRFKIFQQMTCKTSNVIYLIQCSICNKQYVGETRNALHLRINGHRSSIGNISSELPVAKHFQLDGHSQTTMTIIPIDSNANWDATARRRKERFWILQLRSLQPDGLNLDE